MSTAGDTVLLADGAAGLLTGGSVALFAGSPAGCNPCCGTQIGACCKPDGICVEVTKTQCDGFGGQFHGVGTDCVTNPCSTEPGACCNPSGSCTGATSEADCLSGGGSSYLGAGTLCTSDVVCPQTDPPPAEPRPPCCSQSFANCNRINEFQPIVGPPVVFSGILTLAVQCVGNPNFVVRKNISADAFGMGSGDLVSGCVWEPNDSVEVFLGDVVFTNPCGDGFNETFFGLAYELSYSLKFPGLSSSPFTDGTPVFEGGLNSSSVPSIPPSVTSGSNQIGKCGGWRVSRKAGPFSSAGTLSKWVEMDMQAFVGFPSNWTTCSPPPPP